MTGPEVIERVARLLCRLDALRNVGGIGGRLALDEHVEQLWPTFKEDAGRIIAARLAAAREPSEAMLIAARDWSIAKYGKPVGNDGATGCYQAMHDALASELGVGDG